MKAESTDSVVVIGSTNTDLIMQVAALPAPGETVGDATFSQALGGKGANQALAAARSGAKVTFISVVGDDDYGRHARETFSSEGIDVTWMVRDTEPTGTALIFVDKRGENCIGVAPGANAHCDEALISRAGDTIQAAAIVLMQLEIPLESIRAVLNCGTRARLILNAAPMLDLQPADLAGLDTLIVNQTELAQLVARCAVPGSADAPSPDDPMADTDRLNKAAATSESCRQLHEFGVSNVVVTLGSDGVFLSNNANQASQPGFEVDAVDTTGAGDTFCGALAACLATGESVDQAVTYAQAAAALACTRLGAQSAIPDQSAVLAFLRDRG